MDIFHPSTVELLIEDEKLARYLVKPPLFSETNPYFNWFGNFEIKDGISSLTWQYPQETEISQFLQTDGFIFCYPGTISKEPFIFKMSIGFQSYYGICVHQIFENIISIRVIITSYPFFSNFIVLLKKELSILQHQLPKLYTQTRTIRVNPDRRRDLIFEWGLGKVFLQIPEKDLSIIFSHLILERSIIFISSDLSLLSATILCLPLLISPLTYQCHEFPIVPSVLFNLLSAPTPYLAGITEFPSNREEINSTTLIYNLDRQEIVSSISEGYSDLLIPNFNKLLFDIKPYFNMYNGRSYNGRNLLQSQKKELCISVIAAFFEDFFGELFTIEMVQKYRVCKRDNSGGTSIFVPTCFLESISPLDRPFFQTFFQTQIFTEALEIMLCEIDR